MNPLTIALACGMFGCGLLAGVYVTSPHDPPPALAEKRPADCQPVDPFKPTCVMQDKEVVCTRPDGSTFSYEAR